MSILPKLAWLNLGLLTLVLLCFAVLIPARGILAASHLLPVSGVIFALVWAVIAISYFCQIFYQRFKLHRVEIIWDEREDALYYKALSDGFSASWVFIVLGLGYAIYEYQVKGAQPISVTLLAGLLGTAFLVLVLFFSISILRFCGALENFSGSAIKEAAGAGQ